MTESTSLVIIRQHNYWSSGKDLSVARANYKKMTGRYPTSNADITVFTGTKEALDKITVSDIDGNVWYPKTVACTKVQTSK